MKEKIKLCLLKMLNKLIKLSLVHVSKMSEIMVKRSTNL